MLFLLSPAKSLDYDTPAGHLPHTQPLFVPQSTRLIEVLKKKSARQVGKLMDLSENLSTLNVQRYQAWTPEFSEKNAKQAALAFDGDVYDGLQARTLKPADLAWAQQHVCILSGLYGVLRPLDLMQPYRLEMGTSLAVGKSKNLYQYWGPRIAPYLNERLAADRTPVVINLASQEYFRSVDTRALKGRVVECVFEEQRPGGAYKIISFPAKRARGMMARWAIAARAATPKRLEGFNLDGYAFDAAASQPDRMVFRRKAS
ncbi:MAG: peroxide stress protein YaaA [Burkholderiales bacterium]|nr:peroxide stress protein YaaA [Burkholderiales bacterium]